MKLLFRLVVLLLIIGGIYLVAKKLEFPKIIPEPEKVSRSEMVESIIEKCAELSVMKSHYRDVIVVRKSFAIMKSYTIVRYSGVVRIGIDDIRRIRFSIDEESNSLSVTVPKVSILGNDITDQALYDENRNIFVSISTQDIFDEMENSKSDALAQLVDKGLLDDAQTQLANILKALFTPLGFEKVAIYMEGES